MNSANRGPHHLALLGAWSQILIPIGLVAVWIPLSSVIGGMNFEKTEDVATIISEVNAVTRQLAIATDRFSQIMGAAIMGIVAFIIALTRFQYRRRWAFWFSCVHGVVLALLFPVGTPFGVFLFIYALIHRREFGGRLPVAVLIAEPPATV